MAEQKRVRRTPEQIAADIDGQISKLEENIRGLEEKKIAALCRKRPQNWPSAKKKCFPLKSESPAKARPSASGSL